ncbi:MAG: dTDP-4-dehydrorhamnose reductase [Flavobacterium sp.]|nr:dTDP-4-dehydrorhamnose reductase [Flavobacterium sp.]
MVVLVTGAGGQLGQSLQFIAGDYPNIDFKFCDSKELDITNLENVEQIFEHYKPNFCINTAAYTAVDKAESESETAFAINVIGAKNLAQVCKKFDTTLIHISTDFVFDGTSHVAYLETDVTSPKSVYGQTKLDGEKVIQDIWTKHIIVRTSWVYSQFGNNFLKTMMRLGSERETLSVVNDQIGTPTNAVDLANAILKIITTHNLQPTTHNIYNFSNLGQCSWFDFAKKIFEIHNINVDLKPIPTTSYPTPAERPKFSVLDKSKIIETFGIKIKSWDESLKTVVI